MSVVTTSIGPNSGKITYTAGESIANVQAALEAYITAHGWELHDAAAGVNAKAYRALCKDGVTYKYVVLDFNTTGFLLLKVYESWNAGTHAGTNMAYYSDNTSYCQQMFLSAGGSLYVYAHARWLLLVSKVGAMMGSLIGNSWCGCLEIARDNPEDTAVAGYPCWGWANGFLMMSGIQGVFTFCRTRAGAVAGDARYGNVACYLGWGGYGPASNTTYLYYYIPTAADAWGDTNWSATLRVGVMRIVGTNTSSDLRGRLFGLKVLTLGVGGFLDDTSIKTDADFWHDQAGSPTIHKILTETGNAGRFGIPS